MNETQDWVDQTRVLLRQFVRSPRPGVLDKLREHVRGVDLPEVLAYLGCGESCRDCSWGDFGGFHLRETCNLVTFLEGLRDNSFGDRNLASLQPDALNLLGILNRSRKD